MKKEVHDFCDGEISEFEGTIVPKSFWVLVCGLLLWGVYYTLAYIDFVPELLRHVK